MRYIGKFIVLAALLILVGAGCAETNQEQTQVTQEEKTEVKEKLASLNGIWVYKKDEIDLELHLTHTNDNIEGFHCLKNSSDDTKDCSSEELGRTLLGRIDPNGSGEMTIISASNFDRVVVYKTEVTPDEKLKLTKLRGSISDVLPDEIELALQK